MRLPLTSLLLLTAAAVSVPAHAAEIGGGFSVSGNSAVVSDYRFRGLSFSDEDFAIQGGIDLEHESGFYIGTWGSSIEDSPVFGSVELDIYAGWSGEISSGTTLDIGVLAYLYPDGDVGDADYFEPYVSLSHQLGPAEATVGFAYAPDQNALAGDSGYLWGDLSVGIPTTPITIDAHVGYVQGSLSTADGNSYVDWSLGATYALGPLSLGLAYVDTNVSNAATLATPGGYADAIGADATIVFTLGAQF